MANPVISKPSCYTCQNYCDCLQPPNLSAGAASAIASGIYFILEGGELIASDGSVYNNYDALELAWYESFVEQYTCYVENNKGRS